jgi:hypothetical protein
LHDFLTDWSIHLDLDGLRVLQDLGQILQRSADLNEISLELVAVFG